MTYTLPSKTTDLSVSFEFFPPATEKMAAQLWQCVERLSPLQPNFVSITYGAGGATRQNTHRTVARMIEEKNLRSAAHITCVNATKQEVDEVLRNYWDVGVRHIVALRGDPPSGIGEKYTTMPGGYYNAAELCAGARRVADFEISVGCYPEKHPESVDYALDIDLLKRKIDAGATRGLTQFFFTNDVYFRYLDMVQDAGITIPIIPGIMPITNFKALKKITKACGAHVPTRILRLFENLDKDDINTQQMVAAALAAEQCLELAEQGVKEFHFYTLNRADMTFALCHMLGVRSHLEKE